MENEKQHGGTNETPQDQNTLPALAANTMPEVKHDGVALDPEAYAKQEVKKYGLSDEALAKFKEEFGGLTIQDANDKEGYKKVKAAVGILRPTRTGIERKRKELKAEHLVITRIIDSEAKRLTEALEELEAPLAKRIKEIDDEAETEKKRNEEEAEKKINQRIETLKSLGVTFDGSYYVIGETVSIGLLDVRNTSDEGFELMLSQVKIESAKLVEAKRIEDEKAAAELDRQKKEREDFEREKKQQEEQRQQLDKERQELERKQKELTQSIVQGRRQQLLDAGFKYENSNYTWWFTLPVGEVSVADSAVQDLEKFDAAKWSACLEDSIKRVAHMKQKQAEKEESDRAAKQAAEDRKAAEAAEKDEAAKANTEARTKEIAPDISALAAYFANLQDVPVPNLADVKLEESFTAWRAAFATSVEAYKANAK